MKFISHRGNIRGKNLQEENKPSTVVKVVNLGYDCEIDLWYVNDKLFLGHDNPDYLIEQDLLIVLKDFLWIHCKNVDSIMLLNKMSEVGLNYFWHETDKMTLTSNGTIWAYPGNQPITNSIAVLPEINEELGLSSCYGICSDYIEKYREKYEKI